MSSPATTEPQARGWAPTGPTVTTVCAVGILVVGQLYVVLPVLGSLSRFGIVSRRRERERAERYASDLRVKASSLEQPVLTLSGGNQQKVVLAKWLACRVDVLILDEPTRGIDVGAKQEVYQTIHRLARDGVAIVLISSELPEIVGLCDRVLVLRGGRIVGELAGGEASQETVLAHAVGA